MMRSEYANTMSMSCSTWTMALSPTRFDAATDVAILESDVARARPRHAREDVDQGRLAGSVGPDDRDELTRGDPEAHAVERAELSVEFGEPGRLEDHARAGEPGRRRDTRPTSPSGAKITMTASIAPKTSRQ